MLSTMGQSSCSNRNAEHCSPRQRYRILDLERLLSCVGMSGGDQFVTWYRATVDEQVRRGYLVRERFWSEALAVGNEGWVRAAVGNARNVHIESIRPATDPGIRDQAGTYAAFATTRAAQDFWRSRMR